MRRISITLLVVAALTAVGSTLPSRLAQRQALHHGDSWLFSTSYRRDTFRTDVSPADIVTLQMFTPETGDAVAYLPARRADRLVRTADGGKDWRIIAAIPKPFVVSTTEWIEMAFSSPATGYIFDAASGLILFTADAGVTWETLHTAGKPTAISLRGNVLWVTSDFCPGRVTPWLCPTRLLVYTVGRLRPLHEYRIPVKGRATLPRGRFSQREVTLLGRLGEASAVAEEGEDIAPSRTQSLLFTSDGGRQWRLVRDPCEGLVPTSLVVPGRSTWDLYCQLDEGMHHGPTRLYSSRSDGHSWKLIAEGNPEGPDLGNIGDGPGYDLTVSGNGRVLWLLNDVDSVAYSTDGGRAWAASQVPTLGVKTAIATAGPADAWLPVSGFGLYRTTNNRKWTRLD